MKRIRFCFYVSGSYDKPLSRLIGNIGYIASRKDVLKIFGRNTLVSHEEIEFCDRWSEMVAPPLFWNKLKGIWFSSATRGGKTGVRFAPSSEILKHPERWIYITVELPEEVEKAMFDAAKSIEGAGYDYLGIIGKTTWFTDWFHSYNRYYCSEACNWVA